MESRDLVQVKEEPASPPNVPQDVKRDSSDTDDEIKTQAMDYDVENDKSQILIHRDAMEEFKDGLAEIIIGDSLLNDLPTGITLEEVNSLIALEHGQAITVHVRRGDESILPVVVNYNGTVMDLKKAIQRHVALKQLRECGTQHISWHYLWKTYWLYFEGQKLNEDHKKIKEYGICNNDEVTFIKHLRK